MKRKFLSLLCVLALIFSLASCDMLAQILGEDDAHEHTFADATCTAPKTCACGATEGEALGHTFAPATCTAPKTCACGATEGEALGHTFVDGNCACGAADPDYVPPHTHSFAPATCTTPKTCACGATEGDPLPHDFAPATCTTPKTCACGATEGDPLPHDFAPATCTAPKTCACGATEGEALGHTFVDGNCACGAADPDYVPHTHSFADATCTAPKTCTCGATEGEALGHDWADATCTAPKTCATCQATEGDPLPHDFAPATCTAPKTCACGATEGEALPHTYVDGKCECGAIDPDHTHNYTNGICGICGGPDLSFSASMTVPAAPSVDFLEGTWYGRETGNPDHPDADANYEGTHTFVITLDANGKGTVKHSLRGTLNVYSCTINGNTVSLWTQVGGIHLVYNTDNGSFTLRTEQSIDVNFTKGTDLEMIKVDGKDAPAHEHNFVEGKCECGETDPNYAPETPAAPAEISREYLAGTWYGTETGAFDYAGNHTFVIVIDEFGKSGTVTHSALGQFRITNITILDGNSVMMDLTSDTYMISLNYENGVFTLADGKNFTYGRDEFFMSKEAPAHEHNFVEGKCECGETDPNYAPETPAAPSELTEEYLTGTWYGTEIGWDGNTYTFTITFNEYGKGTATHSSLGNFNVTSIIDGGDLLHIMFDFGSYQTSLDYANGTLTLMDGMKNFTNGRDTMTMSKTAPAAPAHECEHACDECGMCTDAECTEDACADKCEGHAPAAPENLTPEYFVGTWTGSETGASWGSYVGDHTFTVTINSDLLTGTVNHSLLGEFAITNITFMSTNVVMMELDSPATFMLSIEYNNGVFTLAEGSNFSYGREYFTMTKGEPAPAPAHECEHACNECGMCTDADCTEDACADKCQGHAPVAPDTLTEEYLVGTWYGTEVDYSGKTYTFTITINENLKSAVVNHSLHGQFSAEVIVDGNKIHLMHNYGSYQTSLTYDKGEFTLLDGTKNFTSGREICTMSKTAPAAPAHECEHACDECGMCTDAECTEDACADKCQGHAPAAPAIPDNLTSEYLIGTWTGTEKDYMKDTYTLSITFMDNGTAVVLHQTMGQLTLSYALYGNELMLNYDGIKFFLDYNNGELSLQEGYNSFTQGTYLVIAKATEEPAPAHECEHVCATCGMCTDADCTEDACADKCEGHTATAPENLTEEYLVGTWTGTEVGGYWYSGTYTFTITFNADGSATMTHSEFGDVEIYDYYIEGNMLMIMCSAENSSVGLEYANGTFTMLEGMKGFTYGTEFTMTKTA